MNRRTECKLQEHAGRMPAPEDEPGSGRPFYSTTPDGKSLVYAQAGPKGGQVLVRDLENGQSRELISAHYWLSGVAPSPDGRQIAFDTQTDPGEAATLKVVPIAGGETRALSG